MKSLLIIIILVYSSCNNIVSEQEAFRAQFDSIKHDLQQNRERVNAHTDSVYARMVDRMQQDNGKARQFYYHIHDFYGYLGNIRWQFYKASGDSSGTRLAPGQENKKALTNGFFADQDNTARLLFTSLRFTFEKLMDFAQDSTVREDIARFEKASLGNMQTNEQFVSIYFRNTEPHTVITILNSFEQKIRQFEIRMLTTYFNNYIHELKEQILRDGNSNRDTVQ